jgi:hypothetical protein
MKAGPRLFCVVLFIFVVAAPVCLAARDDVSRSFKRLEALGPYHGRSISTAGGLRPIRNPGRLHLRFASRRKIHEGPLPEEPEEPTAGRLVLLRAKRIPTLSWDLECNTHTDKVRLTPNRLWVGPDGSGAGDSFEYDCLEVTEDEERWMESFFAADPHWHLRRNRLTLTDRRGRVVLLGNQV